MPYLVKIWVMEQMLATAPVTLLELLLAPATVLMPLLVLVTLLTLLLVQNAALAGEMAPMHCFGATMLER